MKKIIVSGLILTGLLTSLPSLGFSVYNDHVFNAWVDVWRCKQKNGHDCKKVLEVWFPEEWAANGQHVSLPVSVELDDKNGGIDNPQEYKYISMWVKPNGKDKHQFLMNIENCEVIIFDNLHNYMKASPECEIEQHN